MLLNSILLISQGAVMKINVCKEPLKGSYLHFTGREPRHQQFMGYAPGKSNPEEPN